jgi:hypothetical protein
MLTTFYLIQNAGRSIIYSMHHSRIGRTIPPLPPLFFHNLLECLVAQELHPAQDTDNPMLRAFLRMFLRRYSIRISDVITSTHDVIHYSYFGQRLSSMRLGGVISELSVVVELALSLQMFPA